VRAASTDAKASRRSCALHGESASVRGAGRVGRRHNTHPERAQPHPLRCKKYAREDDERLMLSLSLHQNSPKKATRCHLGHTLSLRFAVRVMCASKSKTPLKKLTSKHAQSVCGFEVTYICFAATSAANEWHVMKDFVHKINI